MTITLSRSNRLRAALEGLILAIAVTSAVASAPDSAIAGDRLLSGQQIVLGQTLSSSSGRSRLAVNNWMPNIALYRADCAVPRWAQYKKDGADSDIRAVMQGDGNFVLYHQGWNALWSSGTYGNPGSYIVMQNDGNLVIYNPGGRVLWATGTQEDFSISRPLGMC
ncbi:MAG TPA: hypothetical protein VGR11_13220 [Solirubrobacteraceae bacterium]|nr:hypothetical protein [Solirubrobacteraceae bacterium]